MLALMRLDLEQPPSEQVEARWHARPIRIQHRQIAANVDLEAFGPSWGNDLAGLTDIMRATPKIRSRWVRASGQFAGFAISGAAGDTGYIQRVAVASAFRRLGIADYLVRDAITWMRKNKLAEVLVNAEVTNAAALALYASVGFLPLPEQLTIAQHTFVESGDEF